MTALEPDELVTEIELDSLPSGTGWAFEEFARRHGDYALAAVAVTMERRADAAANIRIGLMGVGETPMRMRRLEAMLEGVEINATMLDQAVDELGAPSNPTPI
jgi:carbon-monoxide dehydrogenase medium subunit